MLFEQNFKNCRSRNLQYLYSLKALKETKGSSRQAILKYIMANFNVGGDAKLVNGRLKTALKRGVTISQLKQSKGVGATGRFRLGEKKAADGKKKATKQKAGKFSLTVFVSEL